MNVFLAALAVTVQPAFGMECRPAWNAGPALVEASNDGVDARRVHVEMTDTPGRLVRVELDLPARSHKRMLVMPPLTGRVEIALVEEDGTRTALAYSMRSECGGPKVAAFLRQDGRAGLAVPAASGSVALEAGTISREDLGEWRPLMSLDAIAAEARAIGELSDAERESIRRWVLAGGVLLLTPGLDPKPLFTSGWLPEGLDTGGEWSSVRWGAGAVAITPDLADPRVGSLVIVTTTARDAWMRATSKIFEHQRDAAGPMGRASRPAGVLTLGAFLLIGGIAHELIRRRFVPAKDFDGYFRGAGAVLGITALSGFAAALAGIAGAAPVDVVLAHRSGWAVRSRAVVLSPGREREIAAGAWTFAEPPMVTSIGARNAVRNGPGATRAALERVQIVVEGLELEGGRRITNRTNLDFEAGALVAPTGCMSIAALPRGGSADAAGGCLDSPDLLGLQELSYALAAPVYVARAGGLRYVITLESP